MTSNLDQPTPGSAWTITLNGPTNPRGVLISASASKNEKNRVGQFSFGSEFKEVSDTTCQGKATITHTNKNSKTLPLVFDYSIPLDFDIAADNQIKFEAIALQTFSDYNILAPLTLTVVNGTPVNLANGNLANGASATAPIFGMLIMMIATMVLVF